MIFLVSIDIDNKRAWQECFKVAGVVLPTGYYFGISAATGDLSDIHDVYSMRLYDLTTPDDVRFFYFYYIWKISYWINYSDLIDKNLKSLSLFS